MQQKTIQFSGDVSLPAIGQGTWYMGEEVSQRKTEVDALRAGIDLGLTLIDTAEMYAEAVPKRWLVKLYPACVIRFSSSPKSIRGMPAGKKPLTLAKPVTSSQYRLSRSLLIALVWQFRV